MLETLKKYQAWRTGEDERMLGGTGLTPAMISKSINWAIDRLSGDNDDLTAAYMKGYQDAKDSEQATKPSDEELIAWAGEENFFLFCDESELLDIARTLFAKFGGKK